MRALQSLLERSLAAQYAVMFLVVAGVTWVLRAPPPGALLVQSAVLTTVGMVLVAARRRKDRALMGGVPAATHLSVERQLRRGQVPRDGTEREAMRRLVAHRRRGLDRSPWLFVPLIVVLVLLPAVWALQGQWTTAVLILVFGIVLGSWATSERRRNRTRLRRADEALRAADTAGSAPALVLGRRAG